MWDEFRIGRYDDLLSCCLLALEAAAQHRDDGYQGESHQQHTVHMQWRKDR